MAEALVQKGHEIISGWSLLFTMIAWRWFFERFKSKFPWELPGCQLCQRGWKSPVQQITTKLVSWQLSFQWSLNTADNAMSVFSPLDSPHKRAAIPGFDAFFFTSYFAFRWYGHSFVALRSPSKRTWWRTCRVCLWKSCHYRQQKHVSRWRQRRNARGAASGWVYIHETSWNGNIFRVTGHLCGEFTGPRWISHTKASDVELWCFRWSASE